MMLFFFKDDGNEGSNNSGRALSEGLRRSGFTTKNVFYCARKVHAGDYEIYLTASRLRRNLSVKKWLGFIFLNPLILFRLFKVEKPKSVIVNNAMMVDVIFRAIVLRIKCYVFIRENHLPQFIVRILLFLLRHGLIELLSNNRSFLSANGLDSKRHIPNIINSSSFAPRKPDITSSIGIIMVGAVYPLKDQLSGFRWACQIADFLSDEHITLTIVGEELDPVYVSQLRDVSEKEKRNNLDLVFKGVVLNAELPRLLQTSNLFFLSSLSEGTPRSLIEALSTGLYCVSTDVGDCSYLVPSKKYGIVKEPGEKLTDGDLLHLSKVLSKSVYHNWPAEFAEGFSEAHAIEGFAKWLK
jgi:glycosyltransferase involved in cell wall biosynthesis